MPSTDFDTLVKNKSSQDDRKEKRPAFFSRLHGIPKQISDSSQSIGVNERTLKNGLMSGVILPSQISHDRWLSVIDGFFDASILFLFFLYISIAGFNLSVLGISIVAIVYMFFHILWWECSIQWYFIETIKDYIIQTRTYYYGALIACFALFSTVGVYYTVKNDITPKIVSFANTVEHTLNNVIEGSSAGGIEENDNKKNKFSNENTYKKTKIEEIKDSKTQTSDVDYRFFIYYYLNSFIGIFFCFSFFKFSNTFYKNKKNRNMEGVEIELKSELELKMALLKEQV